MAAPLRGYLVAGSFGILFDPTQPNVYRGYGRLFNPTVDNVFGGFGDDALDPTMSIDFTDPNASAGVDSSGANVQAYTPSDNGVSLDPTDPIASSVQTPNSVATDVTSPSSSSGINWSSLLSSGAQIGAAAAPAVINAVKTGQISASAANAVLAKIPGAPQLPVSSTSAQTAAAQKAAAANAGGGSNVVLLGLGGLALAALVLTRR